MPHPEGSVTVSVPGPELTGEAVSATPGRAGAAQRPRGSAEARRVSLGAGRSGAGRRPSLLEGRISDSDTVL